MIVEPELYRWLKKAEKATSWKDRKLPRKNQTLKLWFSISESEQDIGFFEPEGFYVFGEVIRVDENFLPPFSEN